jgi:hypothetical protein
VGHSLGGGIALSISARMTKLSEGAQVDAIAFNPSPRVFDGWGARAEDGRRLLIYQEKESLEWIRSLFRRKLKDIVTQFIKVPAVADESPTHEHQVLSCKLRILSAAGATLADAAEACNGPVETTP